MSQENVEMVRRYFEAITEIRLKAIELGHVGSSALAVPELVSEVASLAGEYWDPEAVFDVSGRPDGGIYYGPEGVLQSFADWITAWEDFEIITKEILPAGSKVIVVQDFRGTTRGGIEVELHDHCAVFDIRRGLFTRYHEYLSKPEALKAAGLSVQDPLEHFIRAGYAALSEGDLNAFLETLDPEIELVTSGAFPDFEPTYRGYDGIRRFWNAIREPWEFFELEPELIIEGADRAAVAVQFRVKGAGSGVTTELKQGHAVWLRQGRTVKVSTHPSFEEALHAAGLSDVSDVAGERRLPSR